MCGLCVYASACIFTHAIREQGRNKTYSDKGKREASCEKLSMYCVLPQRRHVKILISEVQNVTSFGNKIVVNIIG